MLIGGKETIMTAQWAAVCIKLLQGAIYENEERDSKSVKPIRRSPLTFELSLVCVVFTGLDFKGLARYNYFVS